MAELAAELPRALVLTRRAGDREDDAVGGRGSAAARERGLRVLSARSSGAEARLSFAALIDLLDEVEAATSWRRCRRRSCRALEVALLRGGDGRPPEPRAIALGFLNALRALARPAGRSWWRSTTSSGSILRPPRRSCSPRGGSRTSRSGSCSPSRPGSPSPLEQALGAAAAGASRGRPAQPRCDAADAVRAARARAFRGTPAPDPRGDAREPALRARARTHAGRARAAGDRRGHARARDGRGASRARAWTRSRTPVRRLLLAVALSGDLRTVPARGDRRARRCRGGASRPGCCSSTAIACARRTRCSPPRRRTRARAGERRELHLELAGVVGDEELRARHLALATEHPDAELAATLAAAAAGGVRSRCAASGRRRAGRARAPADAGRAAGAERAAARARRVPLEAAGERQRVTEPADARGRLPAPRVGARPRLAAAVGGRRRQDVAHATSGCSNGRLRRARATRRCARTCWRRSPYNATAAASSGSATPRRGRWRRCRRPRSGLDVERLVLHALGWARVLRGRPIDDLCERFVGGIGRGVVHRRIARAAWPSDSCWRGDVREAARELPHALALARRRAG